ncbi:MAG: cell division protein SepF [Selenomonadaceae bacterium]|nr:cell division protein SepF [Selenomonadaceae bacterium]
MGLIRKIQDIIMPYPEEELEEETEKTEENAIRDARDEEIVERQVVNGAPVQYSASDFAASGVRAAAGAVRSGRPQLTVHTTKIPELKVQVFAPTNFEQVTGVADDLLSKKAVIINYEMVDHLMQRRICDFVNGVCYVTDGEATRISNNIVLYVPEGVDVTEAMAAVALS